MKKTLSVLIIFLFLLSSIIPITSSYSSFETNKACTIHIDENGTLSGYVTDPAMNPIEGAKVRVYFHETYEENYTDSSGYYHVTNIPICYCLKNATVSKEGYTTKWVLLAIGENTTYDFVLTPLGKTLYVGGDGPGNYSRIQDAIDNATDGDTVFVYGGSYYENIVVDKEGLLLQGENKFNTVIDIENTADDAVVISAEGVTFQGFTVTNARNKDKDIWDQSGIEIYSSNVTVKESIISNNRLGLMTYTSAHNLTICDNSFFYDGFFPGNYLISNDIPKESLFLNVSNNTVNGRPLYYYQTIHNDVVDIDAGQVILVNCTNVIIKDMCLTYTDFSIMLYYCSNCIIENSIVADTDGEVILFYSENNTIQNITSINSMHGICLDIGSKNNTVRYNEVYGNYVGISVITSCSGNRIYGNKIHDNKWGVKITSYSKNLPSHDNIVYENEVYKNSIGIRIATTFGNLPHSTYNNTIINNNLLKNSIGVLLYLSEGNIIKNNTFERNLVSAVFRGCSYNTWHNNYWNRPRIFPKIIFGCGTIGEIPIPRVNVDWHPAKEPFDIP